MATKLKAIIFVGAMALLEVSSLFPLAAQAQRIPNYSANYCESYARDFARRNASSGPLKGAVGGAATGALLGGIFDGGRGAGKGASIGAAVGAIGGGARRAKSYDRLYELAYADCRRGLFPSAY